MLFSGISFLYFFLPVVLFLYFLAPNRMKNTVLLVSSLFFYFTQEPIYILVIVGSTVSGYLHGLWIQKARTTRWKKTALISSIVLGIGVLGFFKYTDFFLINMNALLSTHWGLLHIALPIGISFYTFHILSYTIDVYRGVVQPQRNLFTFMTYVTLFPQLVAGPIVRYVTVEKQLASRTHSWENFAYGVNRFVIGLAKKVLLANVLGELAKTCGNLDEKTVLLYWMGNLAYMLQIYFDFSGYSDMAIGLGRIFGFHFLENFNYPFIAKSISDFWRRWHISLGSWFRDYVYIPLGGNRVSSARWLLNVFLVWLLTGFWHGAAWNFILWGCYFAVALILEKYLFRQILQKLPGWISHVYALFIITISFVIFNNNTVADIVHSLGGMFGANGIPFANDAALYYLRSYAGILILGIIGSTPLVKNMIAKVKERTVAERLVNLLEPVVQTGCMLLVTAYLIDGSFNPFIYFRF